MAPRIDDDFIFTISDHEDVSDDGAELGDEPSKLAGRGKKRKLDDAALVKPKEIQQSKRSKKKSKKREATPELEEVDDNDIAEPAEDVDDNDDIASDFEFAPGDVDIGYVEDFDGWGTEAVATHDPKDRKGTAVDVDEIIERRRNKQKKSQPAEDPDDEEEAKADGFGMGAESEDEEEADEEGEGSLSGEDDTTQDAEQGADDSDAESVAPPVAHPMDLEDADSEEDNEHEESAEAKKAAEFFAPEESVEIQKKKGAKGNSSFQAMSLSRPILKGLASVGFTEPTPIQSKTVPIAMEGKDVVGGAETGSGKTAAFLIPILERLLYRPKKIPTTRVAILMPTRELAVQCFNVAQKLAAFTDITFAQLAGGFSLREQEAVLRTKPDVVIATPGRFIDHMQNSAGFQVETLEILVLDEADRMLEEGFESQLNEILTTIPKSRQTMLFSATMSTSVDKLIQIGMNRPVRLMVDSRKNTVAGLTQEFVRIRKGKEDRRLAYLMYICTKVYTDRVIIFFRQKKEAHRVRVVFALCGLKATELHGNLSQEQASHTPKMGTRPLLTITCSAFKA
jgi:ATP-dependent RNA helicase DDX27